MSAWGTPSRWMMQGQFGTAQSVFLVPAKVYDYSLLETHTPKCTPRIRSLLPREVKLECDPRQPLAAGCRRHTTPAPPDPAGACARDALYRQPHQCRRCYANGIGRLRGCIEPAHRQM